MLVGIRQIILLDYLGITFAHATIEVTANCDLPFWALYYIGVLGIITQSCSQQPLHGNPPTCAVAGSKY